MHPFRPAQVVAAALGPSTGECAEALRRAIAIGADRGVHVARLEPPAPRRSFPRQDAAPRRSDAISGRFGHPPGGRFYTLQRTRWFHLLPLLCCFPFPLPTFPSQEAEGELEQLLVARILAVPGLSSFFPFSGPFPSSCTSPYLHPRIPSSPASDRFTPPDPRGSPSEHSYLQRAPRSTPPPLRPQALAAREGARLVLLGRQAIDSDQGHTGQMVAALLGWPQARELPATAHCCSRRTAAAGLGP